MPSVLQVKARPVSGGSPIPCPSCGVRNGASQPTRSVSTGCTRRAPLPRRNPCVLILRRIPCFVAGFRRPPQKVHINPAAGLMSWMAMPRSLRAEPDASSARSPRDEEGPLSSMAPLAREETAPRGPPPARRSSYRPPSFWTLLRLRADPRGWTASWRVSRLYHHLKPFDKLAYMKHYEGESASASATTGLKLVSRAERARRGR